MNIHQLNEDLVRALGVDIKDKHVVKVTLTLEANEIPKITVERLIVDPSVLDGLQTAVEVLHLKPVPFETK